MALDPRRVRTTHYRDMELWDLYDLLREKWATYRWLIVEDDAQFTAKAEREVSDLVDLLDAMTNRFASSSPLARPA